MGVSGDAVLYGTGADGDGAGVYGLFQCKQCQDLLENNLVPKRPIEVLVGKNNLEVQPIAVNKVMSSSIPLLYLLICLYFSTGSHICVYTRRAKLSSVSCT